MAAVRVQVRDDFINALMTKLQVESYTEVVQEALTLLNWAADESRQGRLILTASDTGENLARLEMPTLTAIRPARTATSA